MKIWKWTYNFLMIGQVEWEIRGKGKVEMARSILGANLDPYLLVPLAAPSFSGCEAFVAAICPLTHFSLAIAWRVSDNGTALLNARGLTLKPILAASLTLEGEEQIYQILAVQWGFQPLNHNKQKCKICPSDNHGSLRKTPAKTQNSEHDHRITSSALRWLCPLCTALTWKASLQKGSVPSLKQS